MQYEVLFLWKYLIPKFVFLFSSWPHEGCFVQSIVWTLFSVLEVFLRYLVILVVYSYLRVLWTKSLTNDSKPVNRSSLTGFTVRWLGQFLICWKPPDAFLLLGVRFHEMTLPESSLDNKGLVACVRSIGKESWEINISQASIYLMPLFS